MAANIISTTAMPRTPEMVKIVFQRFLTMNNSPTKNKEMPCLLLKKEHLNQVRIFLVNCLMPSEARQF